jgi:hypothetical protein
MRSSTARQRQRPTPARAPSPAPAADAHTAAALNWRIVVALVLAAAVPRLVLAVRDQGALWPDEIFQSLEPAHRVVFGYGFVPWEFQAGARSWLFPGVFVLLWKAAAAVGVHSGAAFVVVAKLWMVALAVVGIHAVTRLADRLGGPRAGALGGLLAATYPALIIYGHRCMAEMASGSVLVLVAWLWLEGGRRRMFLAGLLGATAVFLRYQNGLVVLGLFVALLVSPRRREALAFAAGGALGLVGGELLDWITWGRPFHSLAAYLRYNLLQGKSTAYGVAPWSYYLETSWRSTGVSFAVLALGTAAAWRRAPALVTVGLAFVAVHALIPHKEYRFLLPVTPLLVALSAVGLDALLARLFPAGAPAEKEGRARARARKASAEPGPAQRRLRRLLPAVVAGAALGASMISKTVDATLASTGQEAGPDGGEQPVWHHGEGVNLALADVGRRDDVCGVLLAGLGPVWSGGFTYLHRDVPFMDLEDNSFGGDLLPFANYVILRPDDEPPPHYLPLQRIRGWTVLRREGPCAPPPRQLTRLFAEPS